MTWEPPARPDWVRATNAGELAPIAAEAALPLERDALLGAAGLGDMGRYFPDTDPAFRGASSTLFFSKILDLLDEKGYRLASVDTVVILERPRLAPHQQAMRSALAAALRLAPENVNIKAKTAEGLGEIGRGEAAAAQAVAVIERLP